MIPSVVELSHKPFLIDSLNAPYQEMTWQDEDDKEKVKPVSTNYRYLYPSFYYFYKTAYGNVAPSYYEKTATQKEEENRWYGWNYYKTILDKKRLIINKFPIYYVPQAVNFKSIKIQPMNQNISSKKNKNLIIEWTSSNDKDNDVMGYKIYISKKQRGWTYNQWNGDDKLKKFWNNIGGWNPEMYENLFKEPSHEIALIKTKETKLNISLPSNNEYYITVMPYDAHGESVGRKIYPMSNEIKINI